MARPKVAEGKRKSVALMIRVDPGFAELLRLRSAQTGLSQGALLRLSFLNVSAHDLKPVTVKVKKGEQIDISELIRSVKPMESQTAKAEEEERAENQ